MKAPGEAQMHHAAIRIPEKGQAAQDILAEIALRQQEDVRWQDGRVWSLVYFAGEAHGQLLQDAYARYFDSNYLNPFVFKSLQKMELEVVGMAADMLHGNAATVGTMTSGGTESILLAVYSYRERAAKHLRKGQIPEIVAPQTIHPAFDKAAHLFGMKLRKAPVDEAQRAIPEAMQRLINRNTILLVASAPSYPHGVLDPIPELAEIAQAQGLPLHVDACVGGFMLPWVEALGRALPPWDFRVPGVTSISADVHKFGYGAKGASVVLYRDMSWLKHQFFISTDFPGGIYASPTLLGSRPGGAIAAAWAGIRHMGREGYLNMARMLMEQAAELRKGLLAIPEIEIIGDPCMNIVAYTTRHHRPDLFVVSDELEKKGWMVDRQQAPACIHMTVLPDNAAHVNTYLKDLKEAVATAQTHPEKQAEGSAPLYGLMTRVPLRGMVEQNVRRLFMDMYGHPGAVPEDEEEVLTPPGRFMVFINNLLSWWERFRDRKQ